MRTSLFLLALPTVIFAVASPSEGVDSGSIEKLLERISDQKKAALHKRELDSHKADLEKRGKKEGQGRRWVWGNSIIQDSSPTEGLPAVGENANLLTGSASAIPVNTPGAAAILVAPSFPPVPAAPAPTAAAVIAPIGTLDTNFVTITNETAALVNGTAFNGTFASNSTTNSTRRRGHHHLAGVKHSGKMMKKWVWAASIIQDGDTNTVPIVQHTTPAANLVAPTFPPMVAPTFPPQGAPAAPVVTSSASSSTTAAPVSATTTTTKHKHHKKPKSITTSTRSASAASFTPAASSAPVAVKVVVKEASHVPVKAVVVDNIKNSKGGFKREMKPVLRS